MLDITYCSTVNILLVLPLEELVFSLSLLLHCASRCDELVTLHRSQFVGIREDTRSILVHTSLPAEDFETLEARHLYKILFCLTVPYDLDVSLSNIGTVGASNLHKELERKELFHLVP